MTGPSGRHQAWVNASTPSAVPTRVEMSSFVCPGVCSSRTDGGQLDALGVPARPEVAVVHGPVVVHPRVREQRDVDGVVGVVVTDHDVGHLLRLCAEPADRGEQLVAVGDEPRVDDQHQVAVPDQTDGAADVLPVVALPDVALVHDVGDCAAAAERLVVGHQQSLLHWRARRHR